MCVCVCVCVEAHSLSPLCHEVTAQVKQCSFCVKLCSSVCCMCAQTGTPIMCDACMLPAYSYLLCTHMHSYFRENTRDSVDVVLLSNYYSYSNRRF